MSTSAELHNREGERLRQRFERDGLWKGWGASPHETINWERFSRYYERRPERWKRAFSFLAGTVLTETEPGEYDLDDGKVLVNVQQYHTKNEEDTRYEAHRKFADIQYVVLGAERIGITVLDLDTITQPYDDSKDIVFLSGDDGNYYRASKENFFIFLPEDSHRPCIRENAPTLVKKIVVKVRID